MGEFLRVLRSSSEFLGVSWSFSEFLGVPRSSSEFLGVLGVSWLLQDSSVLSCVQFKNCNFFYNLNQFLLKFGPSIGELDSKWIEAVKSYVSYTVPSSKVIATIWKLSWPKTHFEKHHIFHVRKNCVYWSSYEKSLFKMLNFQLSYFQIGTVLWLKLSLRMITNVCCYYIHIIICLVFKGSFHHFETTVFLTL